MVEDLWIRLDDNSKPASHLILLGIGNRHLDNPLPICDPEYLLILLRYLLFNGAMPSEGLVGKEERAERAWLEHELVALG